MTTQAISEITGLPVDTWSEEWRHETEARWILDCLPTRYERNRYLNCDEFDQATRRRVRGIRQMRGESAEAQLRATCMLIVDARKKRATTAA